MSAKLNVDIVAQLKEFNKAMTQLNSEVDGINKKISKGNNDNIKSTNALKGLPGVYTHNSYRKDKTDISPQPKMIAMLESLNK